MVYIHLFLNNVKTLALHSDKIVYIGIANIELALHLTEGTQTIIVILCDNVAVLCHCFIILILNNTI